MSPIAAKAICLPSGEITGWTTPRTWRGAVDVKSRLRRAEVFGAGGGLNRRVELDRLQHAVVGTALANLAVRDVVKLFRRRPRGAERKDVLAASDRLAA